MGEREESKGRPGLGARGPRIPLTEMMGFLDAADVGGELFDEGVAKGLHHAWALNKERKNWMGLGLAIVEQRLGAARRLIEAGAPLEDPEGRAQSALMCVCKHGGAELALLILDRVGVEHEIGRRFSPLVYAAGHGRLDVAEALWGRGVSLPAPGSLGDCAFVHVPTWGKAEGVAYLMARGGRMDLRNEFGQTPLLSACQSHNPERERIIEMLLAAGSDPHARDDNGLGMLASLALWGGLKGVALAIASGAPIDDPDNDGLTPLRFACSRSHGQQDVEQLVAMLLASGADPTAKAIDGYSALDVARAKGLPGLGQMEARLERDALQGVVPRASKASPKRM